jgi:hypothetical protein
VNPQQICQALDQLNDKYFNEAVSSFRNLVDLKVALTKHDQVLDSQIEDLKTNTNA